ncbi:MAG: hypothetical protein N0C81_20390 [Candidatus Thiodiazotropha lotti]|nr:hypothetical protein [Candidatus Thiodiazotropha lotti]MCG7923607.1 hypothetical protein [Candidatus Thiodiazotropha lotti]MCG8005629.1 hypothetical protein [Candidatus Thiodiazotropha lotti]MCG8009989.1 hypothetical protein [Candidatus Thiodiazotropha lotti]MCW4189258.1 hypothetical protein [Candidatus Thiodiazotropha lotti]
MAYENYETVTRLWQRFLREQLAQLPPEERKNLEGEFERRFSELQQDASGDGAYNFPELIGFGGKGVQSFGELPYPHLIPDFDESVMPSQLHAASELYYIYQHERMKVFQVADILRQLFANGRMRIQRGPGARGLYILEKWRPLRYSLRDRMIAYRRVFNYGSAPAPAGAVVNQSFHRQLVAFMSAMSRYFRDLTVGEVIRGSQDIDDRPFGNLASIQRLGTDLRFALDRASYGNILALTQETGHYLKTVLDLFDEPDIKKSFDANTKWDVVENVSNHHLGGMAELSQRAKMAESGRRVLQWIADQDFETTADPLLFRSEAHPFGAHAEAWIAAYRMTAEGRGFKGVDNALKSSLGAVRKPRRAVMAS